MTSAMSLCPLDVEGDDFSRCGSQRGGAQTQATPSNLRKLGFQRVMEDYFHPKSITGRN